jgi:ATP-dependent DNA ligase
MAVNKLPVRSCLIDGEAIVCDQNGLAVFELIRRHGALAIQAKAHCGKEEAAEGGSQARHGA